MSDNIKVVVKVRPLISREINDKLPYQWRVQSNTLYQLDSNGRDNGQSFTFDKVYNDATKTKDVYNDVAKPIVEAATSGINGTIFAYGQTSSGKTFTMSGTEDSPGIIPLSVYSLFEIIKTIPDRDFLVRVSYIEIYNETVKDLLDVTKKIKIHETYEGSIKVDATEKVTSSPDDVLEAMREGDTNRQTGATNMNEKSSRSHSIFQITIESREHIEGEEQAGCVNVSELNLVDLAGSERAGQTGATGIRFKEGTHINKSLSALALVIKQLSEDPKKFANYRDSKLTRILQNSLGGNAKTSIICAITPAAVEETISTLQFATRAKAIKNKPEVNAVATDATMIQSLTKQMAKLQLQLETKKNLEVMLENKKHVEQDLQKQIASLQKLILNGFCQTRSIEHIEGTRRKHQPLRRVTISTLHSIEEHSAPAIPKFCTPSLKYNPMSFPNPSEFVPIPNTNRLESLPEEPARLITPPPIEKKVNFENEVIEIDSDDDSKSTNCSPYHKCYHSISKTPPCILRDKLNRAEKEYQDILEMTEIEKIYQPDVVELMKKLEQTSNVTAELQDELEILKKTSKEKDLEMEHLQNKINRTEAEITITKADLETQRKEYNTKLTDFEVSYETLKKKARLREEELLSLLEEQEKKNKKCEDIGKLPAKPTDKDPVVFMNMSKDISLVNSDNESSITTPSLEESSLQINDLVASLQDQLIEKCQTIVQLEANIASQKQSIDILEQSSHELQGLVHNFKAKLAYVENENGLLQSTVYTLNATIKSQKENLLIAQNDIASYNSVIQELQIKLTKRDNSLNVNIDDSVLETMISNEEKVIANNENMKNIIHSFKIALHNRKKEIEHLKLSIQENNELQNKITVDDRDEKREQIELLNEEISKLTEQASENITTINKLMREKSHLASIEQDLTKKIAEINDRKNELEELYKKSSLCIDNLETTNKELVLALSDKTLKEVEYIQLNNELQKKIDDYSNKIVQNGEEIKSKDNLIHVLKKQNEDTQEYEKQARTAIDKIKSVMSILSGEVQEIPELIGNFVSLLNVLCTGLCTLEDLAKDNISQRNSMLIENSQLKTEILDLSKTLNAETTLLRKEIENSKSDLEKHMYENRNLIEANSKLVDEIKNHQIEIHTKCDDYNSLLSEYNNFKDTEISMRAELLQNKDIISTFIAKEAEYNIQSSELNTKLCEFNKKIQSLNDQLKNKDECLTKSYCVIEDLKSELKQKCTEMTIVQQEHYNLVQEKGQLCENIYRKLCEIMSKHNLENSNSYEDTNRNSLDHILIILDNISCHITSIKVDYDYLNNQLCESKKNITSFFNENQELLSKISEIESENETMSMDLKKMHLDGKNLSDSLLTSNDVLERLKEDVKCKAAEIEEMTNKAKEWKEQFINLDILMNRQMQELQLENEELKTNYRMLENESQNQLNIASKESNDFVSNFETRISTSVVKIKNSVDTMTPPSLLTICCNKIVEAIEPKSNEYASITTSSSTTEIHNTSSMNSCSTCDQLSLELRMLQEENSTISGILQQLETANKELMIEQENVRQEIISLIEPAQELQKKIASHKTNLSILTATTYAENRSLKLQVKSLQHHHSGFHNVCKRDIPEFKRQLRELLMILKDDPSVSEFQNVNLKRYSLPDVLDNNSIAHNLKNESILDGDLLMLDTNVTLTTTGDNTLVGCDQTCLDLTQTMFKEVSCQTNDRNQIEPMLVHCDLSVSEIDNQNLLQQLDELKEDNSKLKAAVDQLSESKQYRSDAQSSPIKIFSSNDDVLCVKCQIQVKKPKNLGIEEKVKDLSQRLKDVQCEKDSFEKKYNDLVLEVPNTDTLVSKLNDIEKEYNMKVDEIKKLSSSLNLKTKELKVLQEENDSLSTQVMENISEVDDLNKELDRIKTQNVELCQKIHTLEARRDTFHCSQCQLKAEALINVQNKASPRTKLSRSLSDSDTSSRNNKICTLQSEIYAGREDCKVLTEDVATIKQHLNCNMSMDLDESMGDSNVFSQAIDFTDVQDSNSQNEKCNMPDIQEERPLDIYTLDKIDCCNYYLEMTGLETEFVSHDVKIIDVMKMFYNNLLTKHGNEVENLLNKLKDFEESRNELQSQIDDIIYKNDKITEEMKLKEKNLNTVSKFISDITSNVNRINKELTCPKDKEDHAEIISKFKKNFLSTLDFEFGISSNNIFEVIVDKYHNDLSNIEKQCVALQTQTHNLDSELHIANVTLTELKTKLCEREAESNLLKAQNEKIFEISNAVTLDIIRREQEMHKSLRESCLKLFEHNLIPSDELDMLEPANKNMNTLIDRVISQHILKREEMEKQALAIDVEKYKTVLDEKEKELIELKTFIQTLKDINNNVTLDLTDKEKELETWKIAHDEINKEYQSKKEEISNSMNLVDKLTKEIISLKEKISFLESTHSTSSTKLHNTIRDMQEEIEKLKSMNQIISKEKETYIIELDKSTETIKANIADIAKMSADILELRDSLKQSSSMIDSFKQEVQSLTVVNAEIKRNLEEKNENNSTLVKNIKIHEKTAEILSKTIERLKKQNEELKIQTAEKQTKIDEVTEKYNVLENEFGELQKLKESLEMRVSQLQECGERPRSSLDTTAEVSRRRRQSMHDNKRALRDLDEHKDMEAVFGSRQKPDDLFMDVDGDDTSGRSTPFGLGRGHDSMLSKTDQSDKDEEHSSRPSSVLAARRRRQSIHDMHRGVARHTPSPHDLSSKVMNELNHSKDTSGNRSSSGEINQLREQLASCQQELEDLKERFKEVDEECDTCVEYLRESREQCGLLRKEKAELEKQIEEMKSSNNTSGSKPSVAHVAVNTNEDWANLHAVVVDRMSYDAEVEKNKRLSKCIEELRYKKQELANTVTKMQKALEKHSSKDVRELEATKEELVTVKMELADLKERYKELDEECDTCAKYLKEREEQCLRLKEAKIALEKKLEELQEDAHTVAHAHAHAHSMRKKRQTIHDLHRDSVLDQADASTETTQDLSSHQADEDDSSQKSNDDTKRLKMMIEVLTHQKMALEKQLKTAQTTPAPNPMYVATGSAIVQNQQLTDVMKENQKLKKINAKLVNICKKRGKNDANRENEDPCEQGSNTNK